MKITKPEIIEHLKVVGMECDKCHTKYRDQMELQEFVNIVFIGGYSSVFGDGTRVEIDICQKCAYEMFKPFARITDLFSEIL